MVFLTSIDILDTGFLTVTNRLGQLPTAQRVNSGQALRLKGVELEIESSSNLDYETFASNLDDEIETDVVSVNADKVKLTLYLNTSSTENNPGVWGTSDMKYLAGLLRLPKTKGFKAIYYPVLASATTVRKNNQQMTFYLGRTDTGESQGDLNLTLANTNTTTVSSQNLTHVKYIPVKFNSCKMTQEPNQGIRVTLEGVRTG